MVASTDNVLSSDRAIQDPIDDRLGLAPFSKHLAESLLTMSPAEGLVIAIYGKWGSGKTSLLHLVEHYLDSKATTIWFNPWWFSGHEDLARRFLGQLRREFSRLGVAVQGLRKSLADYVDLVADVPVGSIDPGSTVAVWGGKAGARAAAKVVRPVDKDVPELKKQIGDVLRKHSKRIIVFVDDIDRLTSDEVRQLFRVIKAIGDFANLTYVLALDKDVAIRALSDTQGIGGYDYLEKIVQVPFELPVPGKTALRSLLSSKLDAILVGTEDTLLDQRYLQSVYFDGIDHFIETPRDVTRFANTLSVTYSAVKGEVNAVDFLAMEALRVFSPAVYDIVRKHREAFAGPPTSGLESTLDKLKPFHDAWIDDVDKRDRDAVVRLLKHVFPKFASIEKDTWAVYHGGNWRQERRVCHVDVFPVYFRLGVPEGSISNAEMTAILGLAGNSEALGQELAALAQQKGDDGTSRARAVLEVLLDYAHSAVRIEDIPGVVQALLDVGDQLLIREDQRPEILDRGNDSRVRGVIRLLLARVDEPTRFQMLTSAVSRSRSIAVLVHCVGAFAAQQGKAGQREPIPEVEWTLSREHMDDMIAQVLDKLRGVARSGALSCAPDLAFVLFRWRDWAGIDEPRAWICELIQSDSGLADLLAGFINRRVVESISEAFPREVLYSDIKALSTFLDPSLIIERARAISAAESALSSDQVKAVAGFVDAYDAMERGEAEDDQLR